MLETSEMDQEAANKHNLLKIKEQSPRLWEYHGSTSMIQMKKSCSLCVCLAFPEFKCYSEQQLLTVWLWLGLASRDACSQQTHWHRESLTSLPCLCSVLRKHYLTFTSSYLSWSQSVIKLRTRPTLHLSQSICFQEGKLLYPPNFVSSHQEF